MSGFEGDTNTHISILMLAKDKAPWIRLAAASVLESAHVELVVIEPGSQDNSAYITQKLKQEYPDQVAVIRDPDNSPAEGLNNGLRAAHGEIVGVLNADDFYLPGALEHVRHYFNSNPEIDILLGAGFLLNESTGEWKFVLSSKISKQSLGLSSQGSLTFFHQGMFYRRLRFIDTFFNSENRINWDKEFLIDLWQKGARIGYLRTPIAVFRLNNYSLTSAGFPSDQVQINQIYFDKKLKFNSNFIFAGKYANVFRILKAIKLLTHVTKIHMKTFIMRANAGPTE